jgi:hypothetical protein
VLSACPSLYARVVSAWLAEHPQIRVLTGWRVIEAVVEDGRVVGLVIDDGRQRIRLRPRSVVDATGTAEIVRLIDSRLVECDDRPAAGSVIFRVRGVVPGTLDFPRGVGVVRAIRDGAENGELPAACAKAWLDTGVYDDEVFVKLFVPVRNLWSSSRVAPREQIPVTREQDSAVGPGAAERPRGARADDRAELIQQAWKARDDVVRFLRKLPGFEQARLTETGDLGIRDGGRIVGEYRLTVEDVRSGRRFDDSIGRCAWPIEFWDPDQGVTIEYLGEGSAYDIPLRSLALRGFENVWAAGKCLSAEPLAQASARVVGTCWAMGEAAGRAAAAR